MTKNHLFKVLFLIVLCSSAQAQTIGSAEEIAEVWLFERIQPAPESVFSKFREAGMDPVNHELTASEKALFRESFSLLPPSYQGVLKAHLHSFSFMDNMPNTALTSTLDTTLYEKKLNITFRAGIFNETVSEWATWKENICYAPSENEDYQLRIEAGDMNAIVYILIHEATHIMDVVQEVTPQTEEEPALAVTPFTRDIWRERNVPVEAYLDSLLETTRFRGGGPIPIERVPEVYRALKQTPFVSLYGMASWSEDLAELETLYHFTKKLKQPYSVLLIKNGKEIFRFEPMESKLVKKRFGLLKQFYSN